MLRKVVEAGRRKGQLVERYVDRGPGRAVLRSDADGRVLPRSTLYGTIRPRDAARAR